MSVNPSDRWLCPNCGEGLHAAVIGENAVEHRGRLYHSPCFRTMVNYEKKRIATTRPLYRNAKVPRGYSESGRS